MAPHGGRADSMECHVGLCLSEFVAGMTCPRCTGLTLDEIDRHNPGHWIYCVNCGWRGDAPYRVAVRRRESPQVAPKRDKDRLYSPAGLASIMSAAAARVGTKLSDEHRAKIAATFARRRALTKESPCKSATAI